MTPATVALETAYFRAGALMLAPSATDLKISDRCSGVILEGRSSFFPSAFGRVSPACVRSINGSLSISATAASIASKSLPAEEVRSVELLCVLRTRG